MPLYEINEREEITMFGLKTELITPLHNTILETALSGDSNTQAFAIGALIGAYNKMHGREALMEMMEDVFAELDVVEHVTQQQTIDRANSFV